MRQGEHIWWFREARQGDLQFPCQYALGAGRRSRPQSQFPEPHQGHHESGEALGAGELEQQQRRLGLQAGRPSKSLPDAGVPRAWRDRPGGTPHAPPLTCRPVGRRDHTCRRDHAPDHNPAGLDHGHLHASAQLGGGDDAPRRHRHERLRRRLRRRGEHHRCQQAGADVALGGPPPGAQRGPDRRSRGHARVAGGDHSAHEAAWLLLHGRRRRGGGPAAADLAARAVGAPGDRAEEGGAASSAARSPGGRRVRVTRSGAGSGDVACRAGGSRTPLRKESVLVLHFSLLPGHRGLRRDGANSR
mmetsp:Transcript_53290/g.143728  ORF Transcript_53290/g.143728 Transcript_53290/m.143728 type:complete len:302 (-) Transcript_53290:868-1773(-)